MTRTVPSRAALVALLVLSCVPAASNASAAAAPRTTPRTPVRSGAAAARAPVAALKRPATAIAAEARAFEDEGDYAKAAARLRELRAQSAPDADLELFLALDEARSGRPDSAWARLTGPLLTAALADSLPATRQREYDFQHREAAWRSGRYEGWNWYVARARAEVALVTRRWREACDAARIAAAARPLSGKDQLLLAVAAGRADRASEAAAAAARAVALDPSLPEAHSLHGLWEWRAGRRANARAAFESAIARDSSYRNAALALARMQLPGMRPDSLPVRFLSGRRQVAMLVSARRPKQEETPRFDQPAGVLGAPRMELDAEMKRQLQLARPLRLFVTVYVDEQGRPVVNDLPFAPAGSLPDRLVADVNTLASTWRFRPAQRLGNPVACWATLELTLNP
ncbi:MAG: hypothetical protein HZA61_13275 [Candidatus Eisenbacteria bacterium]|uniref:Tetratricopeptide repeat protein n=1 Tax=Eiseniibacteriota bacterium TaxID=2212470 RepID=A0A933SID4_UNCEI|nr:hypothetical protein [Candidatus Eisenbacteria bacterium]